MPNVFHNSMVAHVWAQGRQSEGRSHNGNFHFSGPCLYSYRQIIAILVPAWKRGETGRIAFLNENSYSVTTTSHMTDARRALPPDVRPYTVSASFLEQLERMPDYMRKDNSDSVVAAVKDEMDSRFEAAWRALDKASRARQNFPYLMLEAGYEAAAAQELASLYSVRKATPVNLLRAIKCEEKADLKPFLEKQFAAERREKARIEAERRKAAHARSLKHERTRLRIDIEQARTPGLGWMESPCGPVSSYLGEGKASREVWLSYAAWRSLRALESKRTLAPSLREAFKARAAALESEWVPVYVSELRKRTRERVQELFSSARAPSFSYNRNWSGGESAVDPERFTRQTSKALETLATEHRVALVDNVALVNPVTFRVAAEGLTYRFEEAANRLVEMAREAAIARREEAEREERERQAAQFEAWKAGEPVRCPHIYYETTAGGVYMRRRGDTLETSKGARVPWSHAVRVFKALKAIRERGKPWTPNGRILRVGHFQVDRIESDGSFKAACHTFHWPEIADIATRESVFNVEPDESAFTQRQHA